MTELAASGDDRDDVEGRRWLSRQFDAAADRLGVRPVGPLVWGWHLRSVAGPVDGMDGRTWLRVGAEQPRWIEDPQLGYFWTGIPDSAVIDGVPRPLPLDSAEWDEAQEGLRLRADRVTLLPGRPVSPTDALRASTELPDSWWATLRSSVDRIRGIHTARYANRSDPTRRVRAVFGDAVADQFVPRRWETAHGDLHWSNLLGPTLGLLDWELWGQRPVGTDPATLYLFALLDDPTAARVWDLFADQLDTWDGHIAQLRVASRILAHADEGENVDLGAVVRRHITTTVLARSGLRC